MNVLTYSSLEGFNYEEIYSSVSFYKPKEVHFLTELEWDLYCPDNFIASLKNLNVEIKVLLGSFYTQFYDDYLKSKGLEVNDVIFWGTYWFNWAAECLLSEVNFLNYEQKIDFVNPFICLNNRSHLHRCYIVEELSKQNLFDKGIVTFHDFLNENKDFPFIHFDRTPIRLKDNFEQNLDSFNIPKEFHNSFLHIVTEANHLSCFMTEKLVKVLLLKKPFLVLGCPFYYKKLKQLGFELYDEVFNYEFDDELNLEIRTNKLVNNINIVLNQDVNFLYQKLLPKINYNYNRTLEIINDKSLIPKFVQNRINNSEIIQVANDQRNFQLLQRHFL